MPSAMVPPTPLKSLPMDRVAKLRNFLQVMAFTLAVAAIQYAFQPDRPYGPAFLYSPLIGGMTWAIIDLGRELIPSARETGWPEGWQGWLLVATGIAAGYLIGSNIAGALCVQFGLFPPGAPAADDASQLRSSLLVTGLAGLAGTFYFYAINKSDYLEAKAAEARRQASEARLRLLESQLEPHMMFNTLANLRALIGVDPDRAQTMLDHLIAYLRATLSASQAGTHTLAQEFDRLRDYLALMAVRMGPRLHYTLDLPADLQTLEVPPLLLQPLVENSIQHGLEPKVQGGSITVTARRTGSMISLEVADTGMGMDTTSPAKPGQGFGQRQVRERLATLYGSAAAMTFIAGHAGGTRATITFPIKP